MEFKEVVRRRRMVRNYSPAPVDRAVIERVVDAARRAPSAGFSQGVYLVVVTDEDTRKRIAAVAGEDDYAARGFDRWISKAPVHIAVCVSENDYHARYSESDKLAGGKEIEWPIPYWWIDAGATFMTLLLAAVDEGLAAGFFGVHRAGDIETVLGLPTDVKAIGVVTVGRAAPDRPSGSLARGRRPYEEMVRWDSW